MKTLLNFSSSLGGPCPQPLPRLCGSSSKAQRSAAGTRSADSSGERNAGGFPQAEIRHVQRWQLLTKNNYGHSTLTIDGRLQRVDGYAAVKDYKPGSHRAVTFDMGPVFEGQLESAFRTFTKDSASSLLMEDEIQPNANTREATWQFITQADVEVTADGAVLRQNGRTLQLANLSHPQRRFEVVPLDPPPHRLDKRMPGLKRIELHIPASKKETNSLKIRIRLVGQ